MKFFAIKDFIVSLEEKKEYVDDVWELLQKAYQKIGGFKSALTKADLMSDSYLWSLVRRSDTKKITALRIFKKSFGLKSIGMATDGTPQGLAALKKMLRRHLTIAWGEVSGPALKLLLAIGGGKYKVPNTHAEKLLKGKLITLNPDGFSYQRMIGGRLETKVIIGSPKGLGSNG